MKAKHALGGLLALVGAGLGLEAIATGIAPAVVAAGAGVVGALGEGLVAVIGAGVGLVTGRVLSGTPTVETGASGEAVPEETTAETVLEDVEAL